MDWYVWSPEVYPEKWPLKVTSFPTDVSHSKMPGGKCQEAAGLSWVFLALV